MPAYVDGGIRRLGCNAVGDAEALGIEPRDFPELLGRALDRAETLGALAQVGFVKGDAHGDDLVVAPARGTGARAPGNGLNDQLYGLEAPAGGGVVEVAHAHEALAIAREQLLGAALAGAKREARLHARLTKAGAAR